jgi:endonuclease/exonuclease/phosphatase family metal-dependent hydrolase
MHNSLWAEDALTVKAMTFNIRYDNKGDGENRWPKRCDTVVKIIRESECDFVGIQEALPNQVADLLKGLPEYRSLGRSREADAERGEATLILYRHARWQLDAKEKGWFWLSDTPENPGSKTWGNSLPRMVAWGLFCDEKTKRTVYVYNTHFDHVSEPARLKSAKLLQKHIAEQGKLKSVIVLGDFNANKKSEALSYLLDKNSESEAKLVDTFRTIHPDEKLANTFHSFRGGTDGEKIDYILASPHAKVIASEILREEIPSKDKTKRYPSDHYPLTAEFSFSDK